MTGVWKIWIDIWCWAAVGLGVLFALGGFAATDAGARLFYDAVYWPIDGASAFDADMRFTSAVLGCVTLGWAIAIMGLVQTAERAGPSAWRWLTASVVIWYVTDSALSVLTGVPVNVIPNTGLLATYLIPLFASGVLGRGN